MRAAVFRHRPAVRRALLRGSRTTKAAAAYALVALLWTSLGPWPWLVCDVDAAGPPVASAHDRHAHGDASPSHHHHLRDGSEIPGSPTHPLDHDCFACQLLAQLARCAPAAVATPFVPALAPSAEEPPPVIVPLRVAQPVVLPPVRAPPASLA